MGRKNQTNKQTLTAYDIKRNKKESNKQTNKQTLTAYDITAVSALSLGPPAILKASLIFRCRSSIFNNEQMCVYILA